MKVYIAYDDVDQVGLYQSCIGARQALRDAADAYCTKYGLVDSRRRTRWTAGDGGSTSRHIECDGHAWDQWYEVHEVQP